MRRAERLFHLVQLIRGRRLTTAAWAAQRLEVSERTVYRDVADLQRRGVPIDGEAGVGYRMRAGYALPPLMFSADEARALVASVRIARPRLDRALAGHAEHALSKVLAILPPAARAAADSLALFAPDAGVSEPTRDRLALLREAVEQRRYVRLTYRDLADAISERRVRPLACLHWERAWTLAAWCELREDFRSFRIDRIESMQVEDVPFPNEPGRTLADLWRLYAAGD